MKDAKQAHHDVVFIFAVFSFVRALHNSGNTRVFQVVACRPPRLARDYCVSPRRRQKLCNVTDQARLPIKSTIFEILVVYNMTQMLLNTCLGRKNFQVFHGCAGCLDDVIIEACIALDPRYVCVRVLQEAWLWLGIC